MCFWMSLTPFFRFPSLSEGLSLMTQTVMVHIFILVMKRIIYFLYGESELSVFYLQSFLMRLAAFLVIFLGNSIMSMPLRMML